SGGAGRSNARSITTSALGTRSSPGRQRATSSGDASTDSNTRPPPLGRPPPRRRRSWPFLKVLGVCTPPEPSQTPLTGGSSAPLRGVGEGAPVLLDHPRLEGASDLGPAGGRLVEALELRGQVAGVGGVEPPVGQGQPDHLVPRGVHLLRQRTRAVVE